MYLAKVKRKEVTRVPKLLKVPRVKEKITKNLSESIDLTEFWSI
jgi:hypothetical protein